MSQIPQAIAAANNNTSSVRKYKTIRTYLLFLLKSGTIVAQGRAKDIINIEALKTVYGEDICYSVELPYKEISFID